MKRLGKLNAVTYDAGDDFFVDIVDGVNHDGSGNYTAYLYREYMMRVPMYGMDKDDISRKGFLKRIERDLDTYKEIYDDRLDYLEDWDYEDEDDCVCESCMAEMAKANMEGVILLPKLWGSEEEIKAAEDIREMFIGFMNTGFNSQYKQSVTAFINWYVNAYTDARYWIAYKDSFTEMFFIIDRIQEWRNAVA